MNSGKDDLTVMGTKCNFTIRWCVFSIAACTLLLAPSLQPANAAEEQSKFDLAPGYYIYLGPQPGRVAPRAFTINSTGSVYWQDVNATTHDDKLPGLETTFTRPQTSGKTRQSSAQPVSDQFESINYPIIKWRPKPISSIPGGFVQLSTTYEQNGLKYKVTLFRSKSTGAKLTVNSGPSGIKEVSETGTGIPSAPIDIQLLDPNGFKLVQFTIQTNQWDLIPGTNVLEARDQMSCNEWDYKRSRDYAVK